MKKEYDISMAMGKSKIIKTMCKKLGIKCIKLKKSKKVKPSDLIGNFPPDWIEELKKLNK